MEILKKQITDIFKSVHKVYAANTHSGEDMGAFGGKGFILPDI